MSMVAYGLSLLPLIREIEEKLDKGIQVWYADDSGLLGSFNELTKLYKFIEDKGPKWGYYPESRKSTLITKDGMME